MNKGSIYIHIPFCKSKCTYCSFNSVAELKDIDLYVDKLISEIKNTDTDLEINTIYLGGGTPSILDENQIRKIFDAISKFKISTNSEITIEVNPESANEDKLKLYQSLGINRISVGIQSLDDDELKIMNRLHNSNDAIEKIKLISKYFDNIACDLILGLKKNVQILDWIKFLSNYVKSFSIYLLSFDEKAKLNPKTAYIVQNEDDCIDIYDDVVRQLKRLGYERYEVSNFAKKDFKSKHNANYWGRGTYFGFGAGAHSYIAEKELRIENSSDITQYLNDKGKSDKKLSKIEITEERIMLGLRTNVGINIKDVSDFVRKKYVGYYYINGENFILNDEGLKIMNMICVDVIDEFSEVKFH